MMTVSKKIEPRFYSRKEVSNITGISVATLSQMAKRGVGPRCIMPAGFGCAIYPIEETDAWMYGEGSDKASQSNRGGPRERAGRPARKGRPTKKEEVANRKRLDAVLGGDDQSGAGL